MDPSNKPNQKPLWPRLIFRLVGAAVVIGVLVLLLAVFDNNYSLRQPSRAAFQQQLNRELDSAVNWINANGFLCEGNPSLMYMIADMERMSHDSRLQAVLHHYQDNHFTFLSDPLDLAFARIVVRSAKVPSIQIPDLGGALNEVGWTAYALAPDRIALAPDDRASMFSPTKFSWGRRQHQLITLVIYRDYNGSSPELDSTINHLAERVARDAHYDSRLTDAYVQRTAFVLAAGRPDLIRSRWVDRILGRQNSDGSWNYCWYGWCRGILDFQIDDRGSAHATVQAAWALSSLKYKYPEWIDQHYRD